LGTPPATARFDGEAIKNCCLRCPIRACHDGSDVVDCVGRVCPIIALQIATEDSCVGLPVALL